ncbi:hypothetical protein C8034_v003138 [Colletotrichum sidae]|uniref:Uncharacterized protein n=1 Tax=Colletotrichum sidae TaxID=1347389 RepID=A0A4R8TBS4_9PEZI|nr:hypothetical protein C8034_v003138 [Colletotrichum sidae]
MTYETNMSFTARMAASLPNGLAMSTTYIPESQVTLAVVFGCTDHHMQDIQRRIENADDQTHHPLLMPGIFAELERKRLTSIVDDHLDNFVSRSDLFQTTPLSLQSPAMNDKETRKYLALCLQNQELVGHIRAVKRQLSKFLAEIDDVSLELAAIFPGDSEKGQSLAKVGLKMKRRVQDIMREYDDRIDDCNMIISNTSLAMQTVWNHIAREDSATNTRIAKANAAIALAAKNDSAQMKSIAVLTMIYLPVSSVAAMFSMDMFNWEAESTESIVSKHIWLFVIVALCLTIVTLLAWHFGTRREKKRAERSNLAFQEPDGLGSIV